MHLRKAYQIGALIFTFLGGLALVGSTQAAGSPLPEEQYWQRLEETRFLIASLKDLPLPDAHVQLMGEADRWEAVTQVLRPDGSSIPVDHSFLAAQLRADPPDLLRLDQLLSSLLAARPVELSPGLTGLEKDLLDRVLARPEFQWEPSQPSDLEKFIQGLVDNFLKLVARLLPDTIELGGAPLLRYLLTGLGVLALVLALAFALKDLLADLVPETELDPVVGAGDENLTSASAMKRAQELSSGGDYRSAVRYLYLSALFLLEERGLLRYDRSLTNREYLRSVAHLPRLAKLLSQVVEIFDRVWYGYQPLDEATYLAYENQVDELKRQK